MKRRFRPHAAFSLVELLVVLAIVGVLVGVSWPVFKGLLETTRVANAASRWKMALLQTRIAGQAYAEFANRSNTLPVIPGARFGGTAMAVVWDARRGEQSLSFALHNQAARDGSGAMLAPAVQAYSLLTDYEPVSLGRVRVVGLRRRDSASSGLELVPDLADLSVAADSFAICIDPRGVALPPDDRICVNFQEPPPIQPIPAGPWNVWDTAPYDGTTGAGEMLPTALPLAILYFDDKAAPLKNAAGRIPAGVEPNELVRVTGGRVVFLPIQGGVSSVEY